MMTTKAAELNKLGLQANKDGDSARALELFLEAHQLRPDNAAYLISAANMALKTSAPKRAILLYEEVRNLKLTEKQARRR